MKKEIICLSGWGQKFDSLQFIFNDERFKDYEISSLNYSAFKSVEDFFASVKKKSTEIVIGWSLGGQLALRLIEKEILAPKFLILIAPPFQMIKDAKIKSGMSKDTFDEFYKSFSDAPDQTLKKFAILTAMNDKNAAQIAKSLDINDGNFDALKFWLEELSRFSCFDLDFSKTPRTLYFHGAGDMIVHESQAQYFKDRIKNFDLEIFKNCGHAPHLNDAEKMREKIFSSF